MTRSDELYALGQLLGQQRWAALASTGEDGSPLASMVAYASAHDLSALYLHLSRLAAHTGNLLTQPHCSLAVSEADDRRDDPQTLMRVSLECQAETIERDTADYHHIRALYLERLPESAQLFDFPDFLLFRLPIERARFVGGFARAYDYGQAELAQAAQLAAANSGAT